MYNWKCFEFCRRYRTGIQIEEDAVEEVAEVTEAMTIATGTGVRQTMLLSIAVSQISTVTPTDDVTMFQLTTKEK